MYISWCSTIVPCLYMPSSIQMSLQRGECFWCMIQLPVESAIDKKNLATIASLCVCNGIMQWKILCNIINKFECLVWCLIGIVSAFRPWWLLCTKWVCSVQHVVFIFSESTWIYIDWCVTIHLLYVMYFFFYQQNENNDQREQLEWLWLVRVGELLGVFVVCSASRFDCLLALIWLIHPFHSHIRRALIEF